MMTNKARIDQALTLKNICMDKGAYAKPAIDGMTCADRYGG